MELRSTERWRRFVVYHLPMVAYAALVLSLSSIPYLKAPHIKFIAFDKVAHFVEYAVFAGLTFRSFAHLRAIANFSRAFWFSLLFIVVFAFLDEAYQSLIPGRHADPADFATDISGALLMLLLSWLWRRKTWHPAI